MTTDPLRDLSAAWEEGDVYLRLSAFGLCLLALLGVLVCVAWMRYGQDVSAVLENRREQKGGIANAGPKSGGGLNSI